METLDCAVIGAGVVGLAIARRLAMDGRDVVILEAEDAFGTHTSARNSEVIHAGIYYPTGSMKAQLCVAGRQALYPYCAEHNVHHQRIGKVIVACDESEVAGLKKYKAQAEANGVDDLRMLTPVSQSASATKKEVARYSIVPGRLENRTFQDGRRTRCRHAGLDADARANRPTTHRATHAIRNHQRFVHCRRL